jgi:hypothetical protein
MVDKLTRIPLEKDEIALFEDKTLSKEECKRLLHFYRDYHEKNLSFFIRIREVWHRQNPGSEFKGLCANVNPITGAFRPDQMQRYWGWGDARGLGIWSVFLIDDRVPDKAVEIDLGKGEQKKVNLKKTISDYCDILYEGMMARYKKNGNALPFTAEIDTGLADDNPKNRAGGFSNVFAINGFIQYGFLRDKQDALEFGLKLLAGHIDNIVQDTFKSDINVGDARVSRHGPRMITLGAIGEVLKSIKALESRGITRYSKLNQDMVDRAIPFIEYILDNHLRQEPPGYWEMSTADGKPYVNEHGKIVTDPGHATECAGFLAELVPFLPESWGNGKWNRQKVLDAALAIHLFADSIGFSKKGVMFKFVDLNTGESLPDTQAGVDIPTAPWWNVREHCAAALRLYTLREDARLLESFRKAQHASYLYYPNKLIDGQMIQMVDPFTGEPLDIAPSTGNLDPMHDPRARIREIENLEILLKKY